jgi:hypothetical protein
MMDSSHLTSAAAGIGLLACAWIVGRRGMKTRDEFLGTLCLACILLATTQFAAAVPGWLRGQTSWIYVPRLLGLVLIVRQLIRLKLAR